MAGAFEGLLSRLKTLGVKLSVSRIVTPFPGPGTLLVAPEDSARIVMMVCCDVPGCVLDDNDQATTAEGIHWESNLDPLLLSYDVHGPLCQRAWYGKGIAGGTVTVYTVSILP